MDEPKFIHISCFFEGFQSFFAHEGDMMVLTFFPQEGDRRWQKLQETLRGVEVREAEHLLPIFGLTQSI